MPTFETLRQEADNRGLVRKIQKAIAFLAPTSVPLPETLFAADGSLVDLKAAGWLPVGMVSPDGYTFTREISKEDISALGYASPVRSDVTGVVRTVSFTALENTKRHMLELKYGTSLSATTQASNGEIVFDEPDLPVGEEYRLLVIGSDGPASNNWIMGKGYGVAKLASTGDETWGQEGAVQNPYTLDVFTDDAIGTPVRHYIGGTGARAAADELGFTQVPPPAWTASTAYTVGQRVQVTGGVLEATVAGTSGATMPTAPAAVGGTVVDGSVTWTRVS